MIWLAFAFLLSLCVSAQAQLNGGGTGFPGPGMPVAASSYVGPGDVVSGGYVWGSCARAYNAAYANGTNPLCDLKAVTGGATVCTLRVATTGFADLAGSYCAGTTPSAACAAASGGSCVVSQVYDQTGNARHWTQATLANMPGLVFSALNGLPALQCGGAVQLATATLTQAQPLTASAVLNRTGGAVTAGAIGAGGTIAVIGASTTPGNGIASYGSVSTFTMSDNNWHAVSALGNGASGAYNVDGSDTSSANLGANGFGGNAFRLCTDNTNFFTGRLIEGGLWATAFNATQRGNLNTNQHGTNGYNF